jgi:ABC-type nitrate/sulfonate/bicarbonate transport system permease component
MLFGYVHAFLQAYALYFLGGRYPRVGAYLEPLLQAARPPQYVAAPGYAAPPTA